MIKSYFENMMNNLLEEKSRLEKKKILIDNRICEIERFIEILDEKNDTSFESFTPREVNSKNKDKIRELDQEKKNLQNVQVEIKHKLRENEKSREELATMMKEVDNQESHKQSITEEQCVVKNVSRENNMETDTIFCEMDSLIKRMNVALQYIDVDMVRSKLELRQLVSRLEEQLKKVKKLI